MLLVCAAALAIGCGDKAGGRKRLFLYCAAGIRPPIAEMAKTFGKEHGVAVECDYAGSEVLLSRIKLTRLGDLYMPGDAYYVSQAEKEGLIASSKTACYFIPVILVKKGNPKGVETLRDLTRPGLRVGLGDSKACAIGRKSVKLFEKNGIAEEDMEKNVVFRSLTVNELGVHVKLGKIDAAIVWDAVAAYYPDSADIVSIPPEQNLISTLPIAVLSFSQNKELAAEFVGFVTSERGTEILKKHHYVTQLPRP